MWNFWKAKDPEYVRKHNVTFDIPILEVLCFLILCNSLFINDP